MCGRGVGYEGVAHGGVTWQWRGGQGISKQVRKIASWIYIHYLNCFGPILLCAWSPLHLSAEEVTGQGRRRDGVRSSENGGRGDETSFPPSTLKTKDNEAH